jgi:1-acyl-sn-glycerol-3-phosphate acyltransferase
LSTGPGIKREQYAVYRLPVRVQIARWILRPLFRGIFHLISRVRIDGLANVPRSGAYLIAANHVSTYDPPLVVAFWPTAPEAAGAADVWQRAGQGQLVSWYGVIPVHRGAYDRRMMDRVLASLAAGRPLMIMPEGGRSHAPGMRRAEPGAAYIVEKSGVPVVPVGVVGTTDDFFRRALRGERPEAHLYIGKPFKLPPVEGKGEERRRARQRNCDLIMSHIAAMLPPEYRGVYAEPTKGYD